jgi:hypothetical protein
MMQFMDSVKLEGRSTIGILDMTCDSQTSHNVILKKESEMYKDMTMTSLNKEVSRMRKEAWSQVAFVTPHVSNPHDYVNHMFKRP